MQKKIIYGEYTLLHWIELMLRKNVVLPKYQRHFVWTEEQFEKFIVALKKGNFIPPVIIGSFKNENIILDGQQRLTSVLLASIGRFPKPDVFKTTDMTRYVDSSEYELEDANAEPIEWTFNVFTENSANKSKSDILSNINSTKYNPIDAKYCLSDSELNSIYLGFSYIVPMIADENIQQKFYSTVFRDINQQRVALMGQESRRSLYYLDSDLEKFFDPTISRSLKLRQSSKTVQYDFVRALAFLAQFLKDGSETSVAKKCRRQEQLEIYYENFINDVVLDTSDGIFKQFSLYMGKSAIENRGALLETAVAHMTFPNVFPTIIEADVNCFGLIYHVFLNGKSLNSATLSNLKTELATKIDEFKNDTSHSDSPNRVTYIRRRISQSIDIYSRHVI